MYFINLLFMVVFVYVFAPRASPASAISPTVYLTETSGNLRTHDHHCRHLPFAQWTFFIELIVSLILLFLIYKYVLPPINKRWRAPGKDQESLEAATRHALTPEAPTTSVGTCSKRARHQAREYTQANRTAEQCAPMRRRAGRASKSASSATPKSRSRWPQRAVEEAAARMGRSSWKWWSGSSA